MRTEAERQSIVENPACSYWLGKAYRDAVKRDIVDAIRDAALLKDMLDARYDEQLHANMENDAGLFRLVCSNSIVTRRDI